MAKRNAKLNAPRTVDSQPGLPREEKVNMLRTMVFGAGWQRVLKPAIVSIITETTNQVMTGQRAKGEETLGDDALKQRVLALNWVLSWEQRYQEMAEQIHVTDQIVAATERGDGGPM